MNQRVGRLLGLACLQIMDVLQIWRSKLGGRFRDIWTRDWDWVDLFDAYPILYMYMLHQGLLRVRND